MWQWLKETIEELGDALDEANPHLSRDIPQGLSTTGGWYLSPHQHVVEFFVLNAVLLTMVYVLGRVSWRIVLPCDPETVLSAYPNTVLASHGTSCPPSPSRRSGAPGDSKSNQAEGAVRATNLSPAAQHVGNTEPSPRSRKARGRSPSAPASSPRHNEETVGITRRPVLAGNHPSLVAVDLVLACLSVATICSTIVYKALTERLVYLLQPCHVLNFMLAALLWMPGSTPINPAKEMPKPQDWPVGNPSILFNIYLHSMYGAWLGLLLPDMRGLDLPGEQLSFFTQHSLLCFAPLYLIARGRYHILGPRSLYCWAWKFLYHVDILLPLSIYHGGNLNYMMVPPNGPLKMFGIYYRPVMGMVCIVLTLLMRYILTEAALWAFVRPSSTHCLGSSVSYKSLAGIDCSGKSKPSSEKKRS